jgi:hypothetical protein
MKREEMQAMAQLLVDGLPELSPEQCRRVALILNASRPATASRATD